MKTARILLVTLIFLGGHATAQESDNAEPSKNAEPRELADLRGSWKRATLREVDPINAKYMESLKALQDRFAKAAKLEDALAVKAEIDKLEAKDDDEGNAQESKPAADTKGEPKELTALRNTWKKSSAQAMSQFNRKYLDALKAMRDRFTRNANLDDASMVNVEISKLPDQATGKDGKKSAPPVTAKSVLLQGDWLWSGTGVPVKFFGEGRLQSGYSWMTRWAEIDKTKFKIFHPNGSFWALEFDKTFQKAKSIDYPSGMSDGKYLERKK
jgi:hypothetical protein